MKILGNDNFDLEALRGGEWSMIQLDGEGRIDGQGKDLTKILDPEAEAGFWQTVGPQLEGAEVLRPFAFDLSLGSGRLLSFEVVRLPSAEDKGHCFLIREAGRQRAVLEASARAQALIELSYEGFTVFDAQATIVYESASNMRITGYPQDECVGRSLFDFIHPEDAVRLIPRFARLAERPGEMDSDTVRWRHRDGHWIYLEGTVVNQLNDPHIRGMINTFHDVTARVEMERALTAAKEAAEAFQAKQQRFLAMLSHELRTPLTLIKQPLETLFAEEIATADARWGMAARGLQRLESLIEELVDFTVLDSGNARLRVREVAVAPLLADWLAELQPLAEARGMTLRLDEATPEVHAYLDAPKFGKVIGNLVGNAIKFGPAGSEIVVRCRCLGQASAEGLPELFEIEVEDGGVPIPPDDQGRIFERYYQRDAGDDRSREGMGLGLSLAADLVALHGGEIGLRAGEESGNCFWVRLPLGAEHVALDEIALEAGQSVPPPRPLNVFEATAPVSGARPEELSAEGDGTAPARVLIVEDHPDLRRFLGQQLEHIYAIQFSASGDEALPMILADPPDLILSDVMMPGLDGVCLCQKVREHFPSRLLPIILLSAKGQGVDRVAGLEAGANDYLSKPFSMDELRLRMHSLLAVRRAETAEPAAWPEQVRATLTDLLGTGPFGAAELASALGLSPRQLQRRCVAAFGQTPGQLILEVRLREARRLLETGAVDTVAAAAAAVGLSSSYLSRRFRALFNQPAKIFLAAKAAPKTEA